MHRIYFISDVHLESPEDSRGRRLLEFLSRLEPQKDLTHLFLVGDIFDLWIASHRHFVDKFRPLIDELIRLQKGGVEIHYFEGNHDLYLKAYWQDRLGIEVHADPALFAFGPMRIRVEHGDQIDKEDRGYRFLRWFLRTPVMTALARCLPEAVVVRIGESSSHTSRNYTSEIKTITSERAVAKIRQHARETALRESFDLIISGHLHIRDDFKFESGGRTVRSVNLGTWLDRPCAFFVADGDQRFIDL